ncbi:MAG: ornithine cyclodeaminase family protein [Moorea sp. SIO2B7]|nr:ornithine cyclodeaminase family protein [Moorena sp. SIO2B7]
MRLLILNTNDVRAALPMLKAIEAMKQAFGQLSAGNAKIPLRSSIATERGVTLMMPAYLQPSKDLGIKIVYVYGDNPNKNLPTVTATVLVFDPETGLPLALMDGNILTAIRTGAGGGLAADLLARKDAKVVALFGAGVQARAQLQGVMAIRNLERVNLISRTQIKAQKLAQEIANWENAPQVNLVETPREAIENADIVITATTSTTPVFDGNYLKEGTHITAVGAYTPQMQQVDAVTMQRAKVIVDSREACLAEAGDIIIPQVTIDVEIGEIINGIKLGRQTDAEITLFKSVGVAVQDAVAAGVVVEEAQKMGLGKVVEL